MEMIDDVEKDRTSLRVLKIAGIVLAILGVALVIMSIQAHDTEAVPIPNIPYGTTYINVDTTWDSGSATWAGSVYIQSPAKLTMKNVKVTWTSSYRYLRTYDNAELDMDNVTMTALSSSYRYFIYSYSNAKIRVNNSYIQYCYYNYVLGWDQQYTNSTFIDGYYYGAYISASGASWSNNGPIFKNNLIINKYYGLYFYMWGSSATPIVEDNIIMNNQYYGIYVYGGGNVKIKNNTVIKNKGDGIYVYNAGSGIELNDNVIQNNNGYGMRFQSLSSELAIYNNVINQNSNADIYLSSAKIRSINNTIGKVSAANNGELNVYWLMDIYVEWEDGSGPVADADITFWDAQDEGLIDDQVTGSDGWVRGIEVKEYSWKQAGKMIYSPYVVNATKYDIKESIDVDVSGNTVAKVVLDNVPPTLQVEAPVDMALTNNRLVLVRGLTEPGATCLVNFEPVVVEDSGWFETYLNFSTDGTHEISIEVMDESKNSIDTKRTVVIDTVKPSLEIISPEEGMLTNQIALEIEGESEPGVHAQVDGKTVMVDPNGKFSKVVVLSEGKNTFLVSVVDDAGNYQESNVSVSLDITPPNLVVLEPADRISVSSQDIKIVGFIEDGATLKINNMQVRYQAGTFQHSVRLFDGENIINIEAWDISGNYNSKTLTITLDMKPPTLTIIAPKDNLFTNQRIILVAGETDVGSTVTVNGDMADVDPGTGYWEKSYVLKSGTNKISVLSTDLYGNSVSKSVSVVLDEDPPSLTLLTPENGTTVNQDSIRVEGIAELGSYVFINGIEVSVDNGKFSYFAELEEGPNEIIVITRDDALNSMTAKVIVIRDTNVDLRISFPYDGMYTTEDVINVTGSTDPGGEVYINDNLKVPVDKDGTFRTQLSLELGSNDVTITSSDPLGNTKYATMVVTREEPIAEPVNPIKEPEASVVADNSWWIAVAAFLGIVVGAGIMGGAYFATRKRMEERTREQIEELLKEHDEDRAKDVTLVPLTEAADHEVKPRMPVGYKGPPPHIDKPVQTPVQGRAPPTPLVSPASLTAIQGDSDASSGDTEVEIDPEIATCEQRFKEIEGEGKDTTKPRNSLKLAKFFMGKGDKEKMSKYLRKTNELLDDLANEH